MWFRQSNKAPHHRVFNSRREEFLSEPICLGPMDVLQLIQDFDCRLGIDTQGGKRRAYESVLIPYHGFRI